MTNYVKVKAARSSYILQLSSNRPKRLILMVNITIMLVTKLMKIPEKGGCCAQLHICCTFNLYDGIVVETLLFMNIYGRFVKGTDEFAEQFSEEWLIRMISHAIDFVTQY